MPLFGRFGSGARASVAALALVLLPVLGSAQAYTNIPALKKMATAQTLEYNKNLQTATTFVNKHGWPKVIQTSSLSGFLYGFKKNRPIYVGTMSNLFAAQTTGADKLWPGGVSGLNLTGVGVEMGIWEAGGTVDVTHVEFGQRVNYGDNSRIASGHATHVAGTMIAQGINPTAKGMSFMGRLLAFDAGNDTGEAATAVVTNDLPLSNHSYGFIGGWVFGGRGDAKWAWFGDTTISEFEDYGFGQYEGVARAWDQVLYNAPFYLPVISSGNSRGDAPPTQPVDHWVWDPATNQWTNSTTERYDQGLYDTINFGPQQAKNTLTVGAIRQIVGGYTEPSDVVAADFSSAGPADDGRIKPEVVADGVNLFSTFPNNQYGFSSGTSMSAPNTTGSLGLLSQYWKIAHPGIKMRASTMKGLVCHTANEAGADEGPDYEFGFGVVDVFEAGQIIQRSIFDPSIIRTVTIGSNGQVDLPLVVGGEGQVKITICWTDPAGTPGPNALDNRTPMLVNDIDVRLIKNDDQTTFMPWTLDPDNPAAPAVPGDNTRDPQEQIVVNDPESGIYTVRISAKGMVRPSGSQIVSVIISAPVPDGFEDLDILPGSVVGGIQNAIATLTLANPAAEDITVGLVSSAPTIATVPNSVVVPAGKDSVEFLVTTKSVRPPTGQDKVTATISAISDKGARSAELDIVPVTIDDMTFSTYEIVGGNGLVGTVWLNAPAPQNGAVVSLTSNLPSIARSVRNWVVVPRGRTSVQFNIRTAPVVDPTRVTLRASRLGTDITTELLVNRPTVATFTLSKTSVTPGKGGTTIQGTVTLNGPAPKSGAVIALSSNKAAAVVPTSVKIPSGKNTATFDIVVNSVGTVTDVKLTATRFNVSQEANLTVNP